MSDWPVEKWLDRRLLLGVSGGADSVALLLALNELAAPGQLVIAHLNHGWRGQESQGDAAFVVKLCDRLDRQCIAGLLQDRDSAALSQSDVSACREHAMLAKESERGSEALAESNVREDDAQMVQRTEEKARTARYDFFKQTAYQVGASYVVTAHTADDRIETLLHNMFRGSGLAGAASLVMFRAFDEDLVLARPLLKKRRHEIEAFLKARGQSFREDSSNLLTHYRRNFLRREVLPLVAQQYAAAPLSLLNFSELAEEVMADLDQLAGQWLQAIGHQLPTGQIPCSFTAPLADLNSVPWSVLQAALRRVWLENGWPQADMSRTHWQSLRELCGRAVGVVNLPGNLRAEIQNGKLTISSI